MSDIANVNATDWFDIGPVGVIAKQDDIPQGVWESVTASLLNFTKALPWVIGDLLNYGESRYGDTYTQAIDLTGLSYHTLAQYKSVCLAIPIEQREANVPYSYYRRIKALPEGERQDWIDRAAQGDFGNGDSLRDALQEHKDPPELTPILCPCCLSQLDEHALEKGKCQKCRGVAAEWARRFGELLTAAQALRTDGDVVPFESFCTGYNIEEDK